VLAYVLMPLSISSVVHQQRGGLNEDGIGGARVEDIEVVDVESQWQTCRFASLAPAPMPSWMWTWGIERMALTVKSGHCEGLGVMKGGVW
jgi:hypothetical protein